MIRIPWLHGHKSQSDADASWYQTMAAGHDGPVAPAAHGTWGPEYWPQEVRENLTNWPPTFKERQVIDAVRTPWTGPVVLSVMGRKHGVGKSTIARLLQQIYALHRNDTVVVVRHSAVQETAVKPDPAAYAQVGSTAKSPNGLTAYPGNASRPPEAEAVQVMPGTRLAIADAPASPSQIRELLARLRQEYSLVICDIEEGTPDAAIFAYLSQSTQLLMVATPSIDGVYAASSTLSWLREQGFRELSDKAIVGINQIRTIPFSTLVSITRYFQQHHRTVVRIVWDRAIARDVHVPDLDSLLPSTRTGLYELAAAVATQSCYSRA